MKPMISSTPGTTAIGEHRAPPALARQRVVDEVGDEDADRDRQLVRGDEPAAEPLRGHLGRVERGDDGGEADAEAGHEATDGEDVRARRGRFEHRAEVNRTPATMAARRRPSSVGDRAGDERTDAARRA